MQSLAIVVPKKRAEQVRKRLIEKGALRTDLRAESDAKHVYFPVRQHLDMGFELLTRSFKELKQLPNDYRQLLELPEELQSLLPSSFDVIGHVAIVKLPEELIQYGKEVGKAIARVNKPVKTVCLDAGVKGEARKRALKILHGSKDTLTRYKEHGLVFKVDPRKMFFSPRLATERRIVANQVMDGERVFDMFAGVGPFSILIAKTRAPEMVYACDFNEQAYGFLTENIRINKVETKVTSLLGDVRAISSDIPMVHRIIMNLPHSAFEFIDLAAEKLMDHGIIHYYEITGEENLKERVEKIKKRFSDIGRNQMAIEIRTVKSYSPTLKYYAMDIAIT